LYFGGELALLMVIVLGFLGRGEALCSVDSSM
jgi:hypothetical protein